jgi:cytochrome oxidase Cu insertion factor (SCO1/SenC/PrrC family)
MALMRSSGHATSPTPILSGAPMTWEPGARAAPAFRLRDEHGKPISLTAFRGRPVVVTFIDPLCRNYCPLEAARLADVVRSLPAASRPAIVAVSVNVHGNAQPYLLQDERKWDVGPEWHWAVGGGARLAAVWRKYDIGVQVTAKKLAGVTVYNVTHTEAAYVVDPRGYERALYLWPFTAADMKATLQGLA